MGRAVLNGPRAGALMCGRNLGNWWHSSRDNVLIAAMAISASVHGLPHVANDEKVVGSNKPSPPSLLQLFPQPYHSPAWQPCNTYWLKGEGLSIKTGTISGRLLTKLVWPCKPRNKPSPRLLSQSRGRKWLQAEDREERGKVTQK